MKIFLASFLFLILWAELTLANKDEIIVKDIDTISYDELSLPNKNWPNITPVIWHESNPELIETIISNLAHTPHNKKLKSLKEKLLLTGYALERPTYDDGHFLFTTRLKILALNGKYESITKLNALLPEQLRNEEIERITSIAHFLKHSHKKSCQEHSSSFDRYSTGYWQTLKILCQGVNGKKEQAELSKKLLLEDGYAIAESFAPILNHAIEKASLSDKAAFHQWLRDSLHAHRILPKPRLNLDHKKYRYQKTKLTAPHFNPKALNESIHTLTQFYLNAHQLGLDTRQEREAIFIYSISHGLLIPNELITSLLYDASSNLRKGEALALILYIMKDTPFSSIPPFWQYHITHNLHEIGYGHLVVEWVK